MHFSVDPMVAWGGSGVRRTATLVAVALLAVAVLVSVPSVATAWNQAGAEGSLWQLLNGARVNNGRAPLQQNGTLVGIARWRSQDMVDRGYFSHDVLGSGCQVYCWYDSNGVAYTFGGENIGWNSGWSDAESPVRVHEGFMGSPGHRANVLEPAFTHGGVGAYGRDGQSSLGGTPVTNIRMYTELFLQAPAAAPPPPPPAPAPQPAPRAPAPAPAPQAPAPQPAPGAAQPGSGGSGGGGAATGEAADDAADEDQEDEGADDAADEEATDAESAWERSSDLARSGMLALDFGLGASAPDTSETPTRPAVESVESRQTARVVTPPPAEAGVFEAFLSSLMGFLFD